MSAISQPAGSRPRALVVDDDDTLRFLAQLSMEEGGFAVQTCADGESALALLRAGAFDLVILDVTMPGISGFDVCHAMRMDPANRHVPVIITTGLDDDESIDRAYECGATDFITKPINWTALMYRARYVLRASQAFGEVLENQRRLDHAQRVAEVGDWEWNLATDGFRASDEACRLLGVPPGNTITRIAELFHCCDETERIRLMAGLVEVRDLGEGFAMDHQVDPPGGERRYVHHLIEPYRDQDGGPTVRVVGTVQDITRRKVAEDRIRRLAYVDVLTGLPNRLSLANSLRAEVARAERAGSMVGVMFLDLDGFKRVNDTLGHDAGDLLLKATAVRLTRALRNSDTVARFFDEPQGMSAARLGGDEFVVVLPDLAGPEFAAGVAQRIIHTLRDPIDIDGQDVQVSTSIGIASYPADGTTADALLVSADAAMYHAKLNGRNGFQFFQPAMNAKAQDRLRLEAELESGLVFGEFELLFLARLGLRSDRITGFEALIRWNHPSRGMLMPNQFLKAGIAAPLLARIEDWVLEDACRVASRLAGTVAAATPVSVNVSESFLRRADCVESVERAIARARIDPEAIELELPAAALVQQPELIDRALHRLHDLGVRFVVDDFGVGHTSLPQLKRLPIQALKIDQSFSMSAMAQSEDAAILRSIVGLARGLNVQTIAEGVESVPQLELLRSVGCDHCQGFLVRPPTSEQALLASLDGRADLHWDQGTVSQ